ncbi:hypothetical protein PEDI_35050 [Persicobacter diffluens]|uniref:Lipoprotein n=1 Tax=Persicobacter diffluens TaxID=981 RepID=A0AAN5ANK4_9BACT|nr:hypothetical protein PEDI_35050 [Persicobacter diffluens]
MNMKTIIFLIHLSILSSSMSCNKWAKYLVNSSVQVILDPIILVDGNLEFDLWIGIPTSDYNKIDSIEYFLFYVNQVEEKD